MSKMRVMHGTWSVQGKYRGNGQTNAGVSLCTGMYSRGSQTPTKV